MKMEPQQFDRVIADKLQNLEPSFQPMHWERMASALDQQEAELQTEMANRAFDRAVYQKMRHFQAGTVNNHWSVLRQRMDAALQLRRMILGTKASEIGILALMLLLLGQLTPLGHPNRPLPEHRVFDKVQSIPVALLEYPVFVKPSKEDPKFVKTATQNTPGAALETPVSNHHHVQVEETIPGDPLGLINRLDRAMPSLELPVAHIPLDLEADLPKTSIAQSLSTDQKHLDLAFAALPTFKPTQLSIDQSPWALNQAFKTVRRNGAVYVAMFGGPEYNRITTPDIEEKRIEKFSRYALGYSGGISVSTEFGHWEVGTGLIYSPKQYSPPNVTVYGGSVETGITGEKFRDVSLNIINIPLSTRYNFYHHKRTRMYATGGLSLQFASQATYTISSPDTYPSVPEPRTSQFDNTNKGFLEGGSFRKNAFVTGNLGLGVERFVTERWSVFFQPTYQHNIGQFSAGFGPTRDRIGTMSTWVGVRVRMLR
jgi:Outer membrane protein beta-barrel domain